MEQPFSPKLKAAMKDIKNTMKKYDIGGAVVLADGQGMSEYMLHIAEPSWSTINQKDHSLDKIAMHMKIHMKSKPEQTSATINMLYIIREVVANAIFRPVHELMEIVTKHVEIEPDKPVHTPGE